MLQLDDLNQNAVSCQEKSEKKGNTRNTFVKKNYAVKQSFECVSFRKNCGCCQTYDQNRFRHKELPELGQRSQVSWSPGRRTSLDDGLAFRKDADWSWFGFFRFSGNSRVGSSQLRLTHFVGSVHDESFS